MATYVIETYLSRARATELETVTARLRDAIAATALTIDPPTAGPPVLWVRSYFVPEDEVVLHIVEAPSREILEDVRRRAGLDGGRFVEAEARPKARP